MNENENSTAAEILEQTVVYPEISLSYIADRLLAAHSALIICHVNPDGDTIGSAFALSRMLNAMGKRTRVACDAEIPKRLRFLADTEEGVEPVITSPDPENVRAEYDLIFSVDVSAPIQLGGMAALIPEIDFMIDHHGTGEPFAPNYVDPEASAAGEIVYKIYAILKARGVPQLPEAARRIYAAIVSDTGSFKFSNTTPSTHMIAAELVHEINGADDGGMDTADVCRSLFGQRTLKELTAQMLAIQNLRFYEDGRLGAVLFTQDMLAAAGLTEEEIGNVVDTPRGVEGVLIGISLRQLSADHSQYKVSSRANTEIDCAAVCAAFGGGGHTRAAGCTVTADSPEAALEMVTDAFRAAIRESGR